MEFLEEANYQLKEIQTLEGHTDRVWSLAWNPSTGRDGVPPLLASCSGDKTVRIWERNLSSGSWDCKAVLDETHTRTVRSCAWSPSGKLLATASFDATTAIWENIGGDYECVSTLEVYFSVHDYLFNLVGMGHENEVKSVAWNASGSLLATCSRDKSVWIWEAMPGNEFECVSVLQGHAQDVKMVQWHPTMDVLFSCSYDNTIKVWWAEDVDSDNWQCVQTIGESNKYYTPTSLYAFSAPLLASSSSGFIFDTPGFLISGHSSTVWALSFNAEGDKMVSCSDDLTLKIWEADITRMQSGDGYAPWRHMCTLSGYHDRTIFSVHWSREGIIASGAADDAVRLFVESKDALIDGPSYKMLLKKEKAHDMDVNSVQWSPGERPLLASTSDDGTIKIWELASTL
ncbi:hypothetical protein Pint_36003 [Pistacia integerrima]|uniref:Uncharacterized protein n=1 Tax=Pistacia integerrima TaxID=434235 RepID=A0ACC0Y2J1_9ROSI|nr:hypothetical protein Pint_36003 [Pistacia integerrima]